MIQAKNDEKGRATTGPGESADALALDTISIRYGEGGPSPYTAVENLSLSVGAGEFVSIVGPSGCGKSTLLEVAAGLLNPTRGTVHSYGKPLKGLNKRAGYVFQKDALLPWKTILGNVRLGLDIQGVSKSEANDRSMDWLRRVGLAKFADRYPKQLSGGMRRRVAIAQAWATQPDILLMDEPFSALDVQMRQQMGSELLQLWSGSGTSVLFVTHDLEEAIALSDRVVVMSAGPSSSDIANHQISIERPRNIIDLRLTDHFMHYYQSIWGDLRQEVIKSHTDLDDAAG